MLAVMDSEPYKELLPLLSTWMNISAAILAYKCPEAIVQAARIGSWTQIEFKIRS